MERDGWEGYIDNIDNIDRKREGTATNKEITPVHGSGHLYIGYGGRGITTISKYYSFFDVSIVPTCFLFVPFTIVSIVRVFLIFFQQNTTNKKHLVGHDDNHQKHFLLDVVVTLPP
jgi:hypothetical protein